MGAANKRGSFEQRQKAAYDRIDAAVAELAEYHKKVDEAELQSAAMMKTNAAQFITAWWEYSGIENRIARKSALDMVLDGAR